MTQVSEDTIEELDTGIAESDAAPAQRRSVTFDVTGSAVAKIVAGLLMLAFIGDVAAQMREVFVWTLAAAFLAIALNPLVERLEPRLGRRVAATLVVLASVIGFLRVVAALVVPFVTQVDSLSTAFPEAISAARQDSTLKSLDRRYHIAEHARQHLDSLPDVVFGAAGAVSGRCRRRLDDLLPDPLPALRAPGDRGRDAGPDPARTQTQDRRRGQPHEPERRRLRRREPGDLGDLRCRHHHRPLPPRRALLARARRVHGGVRPDPAGRGHDRLGGGDRRGLHLRRHDAPGSRCS